MVIKKKKGAQPGNKNGMTHGERKPLTPEYLAWRSMRERCKNPRHKVYEQYGGRGITVCERWDASYLDFLADMGRKPSSSHSLDRIDNNKGYSPDNCRWATKKEQGRNRRDNTVIEFQGKRMCVADWADEFGMSRNALYIRLKNNWPIAEALTKPVQPRNQR